MEQGAKVLVVDDEPNVLRSLVQYLTIEEFNVETASNGVEALEKVESFSPELILLDVMMPELDGFGLCRMIKAEEDLQLIPIVMVTALDSKGDKIKGLEAGCDDFMSKPIDRIELTARVKSLARLRRLTENLDDAEKVLEMLARGVEVEQMLGHSGVLVQGDLMVCITVPMVGEIDDEIESSHGVTGCL